MSESAVVGFDCDYGCGCGERHCVRDGRIECVACLLTRQRDEWKRLALRDPMQLSDVTWRDCYEQLAEANQAHMRERDEARALVESLKAGNRKLHDQNTELMADVDQARAEVERLKTELVAVHAEADREAMHAIAHAARLKAELPKQWQLGSIALAEEPEREELARLRVEVERLREENARLVGEVGNCDDCGKPAGIRACLGCYEKRALKAEAELALWAEKDGNSPGYNLEKARTYGRLAAEARAERDEARAALASVNFWLDEFAAPQGASPEAIAQASKTQGDVLRARLSEARAEVERLKAGIEAGLEEQSLNWHRFTALGETKHRAALEALRERCAAAVEFSLAGFSCVCSFRAAEAVRAVSLEPHE